MNFEKDQEILKNPTEYDFKKEPKSHKQLPKPSKDQLAFKLEKNIFNLNYFWGGLKYNIKKKNRELEISQVWKSVSLPLAIVSSLLLFIFIVLGGLLVFNDLPSTIPLVFNSTEERWEQVDKSIIFVLGIFLGVLEFTSIQFIFKIVRQDKRLAYTFAWLITYLNLMLWFALSQIYTLIR
ncbi:MAG: hypothetical protein KatS3mg085_731 [Candidatus Dojkabacteria bacterium]|nr:MAG: hypothetical protein KatS3mg085_731 [Candidatus Dojkabacteria bacterium]GIW58748.1 MAG: hypothetical protein KatS3mg086_033 [Candidatus Dojkabacteria bacterium]